MGRTCTYPFGFDPHHMLAHMSIKPLHTSLHHRQGGATSAMIRHVVILDHAQLVDVDEDEENTEHEHRKHQCEHPIGAEDVVAAAFFGGGAAGKGHL